MLMPSRVYYICNAIFCRGGGGGAEARAGGAPAPGVAGRAWYFGAITRTHCDTLLNQHGHDGDFLIRDSETNVGDFSVSLKVSRSLIAIFLHYDFILSIHINARCTRQGYRLIYSKFSRFIVCFSLFKKIS